LRCSWCDTAYAFYAGNDLTIEETLQKVDTFGLPLVEITGGEPLLQEDVYPLMEALLKKGYRVMLETSGALPIDKVPQRVIKILDIKCPGSGEEKKNHLENLKLLSPHDEVKFVLLDRADYEWSRDLLRKYDLAPSTQVLFSPVYDKLNLKDLSQWILKDRLAVRLQTQLHKVIWSKDAIGV
jgi:7-carboxy-7-deazaguanine synthase